ncbi:unnamed protein product [Diplocarpon coronariae]
MPANRSTTFTRSESTGRGTRDGEGAYQRKPGHAQALGSWARLPSQTCARRASHATTRRRRRSVPPARAPPLSSHARPATNPVLRRVKWPWVMVEIRGSHGIRGKERHFSIASESLPEWRPKILEVK